MTYKIVKLVALCSTILVLFFSMVGTAFATNSGTKNTPSAKNVSSFSKVFKLVDPKKGINGLIPKVTIGSGCYAEVLAYKFTSTTLEGSTVTTCNGYVTAIDTVNKFFYCTAGIPSLDVCWGSWQLKHIGSSCIRDAVKSQSCPSGGEDTYSVGTNQLWDFQGAVCVDFPSGSVQCGAQGVDVAF